MASTTSPKGSATFYAETMGRPSLPPGIYFRVLLIGYGLWIRTLCGVGTPRGLQGRSTASATLVNALWTLIDDTMTAVGPQRRHLVRPDPQSIGIVFVGSFA